MFELLLSQVFHVLQQKVYNNSYIYLNNYTVTQFFVNNYASICFLY